MPRGSSRPWPAAAWRLAPAGVPRPPLGWLDCGGRGEEATWTGARLPLHGGCWDGRGSWLRPPPRRRVMEDGDPPPLTLPRHHVDSGCAAELGFPRPGRAGSGCCISAPSQPRLSGWAGVRPVMAWRGPRLHQAVGSRRSCSVISSRGIHPAEEESVPLFPLLRPGSAAAGLGTPCAGA